MIRRTVEPLLAAEDLYELPRDEGRQELLRGVLVSEPPPGGTHGRLLSRLGALLHEFVRPRRLGIIYGGDTGFILARSPDTVRAPDVAFITMERFQALEDESRYIPGAPDLAVEILSPGDRPGEVHGKVADWLAAGARLVWVVDPAAQLVSVFRSPFKPRVLRGDDVLEGDDVIPGFSVQVTEIFEI